MNTLQCCSAAFLQVHLLFLLPGLLASFIMCIKKTVLPGKYIKLWTLPMQSCWLCKPPQNQTFSLRCCEHLVRHPGSSAPPWTGPQPLAVSTQICWSMLGWEGGEMVKGFSSCFWGWGMHVSAFESVHLCNPLITENGGKSPQVYSASSPCPKAGSAVHKMFLIVHLQPEQTNI